jgi:thiol:disulfide interchange protein DsbG
MKKFITSMVALACFSLSSFSYAADSSPAESLIQKVTAGRNYTVQKTFDAPGNLEGFLLKPRAGKPIIMYADKDGKFVVSGNVWGANGVDVAKVDNDKYIQSELTKIVFEHLNQVTTFTQGNKDAKYSMYVVADPNCGACHSFYRNALPAIKAGELKVQWILVGFLRATSMARAATILTASNPSEAFLSNEVKYSNATGEGGAKALNPIPAAVQTQLDGNMSFFSDSGLRSTPTLIFWNKEGKQEFVAGSPRDIDGFLNQVGPTIKQ